MESRRYRHEDLFEYGCRVLERLDVPAAHARDVAGCLIKAELRGVDSHGLVRLPVYARRVQAGVVKARPDIRLISSGTAAALVDGDNGLGPVVGTRAMEAALELARSHGTGFVGVRHSNHFGPAAYYVEKAVSEGFIGVAISNAPPHMAPFGGKARFLGTNPVAIGIPAGEEDPLIFDASTSVVARGKIIMAAHTKTPIPEGWAIDPEGYPTTDPEAGARRRGAAVRRTEGLGDLVHHRRALRRHDRRVVRVAPEHGWRISRPNRTSATSSRRSGRTCSFPRRSSRTEWMPS